MMMKDVYSVCIQWISTFVICGSDSPAHTAVCAMDDDEIVRLLQDAQVATSASQSMEDPRPQVLAEAIVAYALNNRTNLLPRKDFICFSLSLWPEPVRFSTSLPLSLASVQQSRLPRIYHLKK
jgi:hypothetical protein